VWLGLAALGLGLVFWSSARAADHADGPATTNDPSADIDDVFAWMSPDAADLNLAMTIGRDVPATFRLSDQVQYVFHTQSRATFGAAPAQSFDVICESDRSGEIRCWGGTEIFLGGDASDPRGLESRDGRMRIFGGLRNDPFFFNLKGFQGVAKTVGTVAGALSFDQAGCPQLDAATSNVLVGGLKSGNDDFLGFNAFALVVSLDKGLVTRGGPIVSVWGSTHRKAS
jgi:hypothetical protein